MTMIRRNRRRGHPMGRMGLPQIEDMTSTLPEIVQVWMLRFLLKTSQRMGLTKILRQQGDDFLQSLGFDMEDYEDEDHTSQHAVSWLRQRLRELERRSVALDQPLARNLDLLGERIGLNSTERMLLSFFLLVKRLEPMSDLFSMHREHSFNRIPHFLAQILDMDVLSIQQAIKADGRLVRSGLLGVSRNNSYRDSIVDWFEPLEDLSYILFLDHVDSNGLVSHFLKPLSGSHLEPDDFPHVAVEMDHMLRYLEGSLAERSPGCNILIHGPTGCGKTELVRLLARLLGKNLFQVRSETIDENRSDRFEEFRLCQKLLEKDPDSLILFDEVEDVFPNEGFSIFSFFKSTAKPKEHKAWINQMLEENPVPTFWLSNAIGQIDPAYIRRFDHVLKLDTPPRSVRLRMLNRELPATMASTSWKKRVSTLEGLTPAQIRKAAKVARLMKRKTVKENEQVMERTIMASLEAIGVPTRIESDVSGEIPYDISFVNTDYDLEQLVKGLRRSCRAKICLHGPPGTGKTRFAHHVAEALERPLIVKQASDLLSPWVGMTERNLAEMFREAKAEKGILLLDEADSFLRDRSSARSGWEVTQVNELLVQMEQFDGIFICSTNLMESFDPASLRRFDLKISMRPMTGGQALSLFASILKEEEKGLFMWKERLAAMTNLTPGDFRTAVRRAGVMGLELDAASLMEALRLESEAKPDGRKRIVGFVA